MARIGGRLFLLSMLVVLISGCGESFSDNFVKNREGVLYVGSRPLHFFSVNIPNYTVVEDPRSGATGWHRVTAFEQEDAARTVEALGGQVFRTYVFSVEGGKNNTPALSHIYRGSDGAISYHEDLFRDLDRGLAIAAAHHLKVIIPLVDNWNWWGGYTDWEALSGGDSFWTEGKTQAEFRKFLAWLVNRTNTVNGKQYKNDPTILAWELGNELDMASAGWMASTASYLKSLDANHMIINGGYQTITQEMVDAKDLDILTTHYNNWKIAGSTRWAKTGGKAYLYGEFDPSDTATVNAVAQEAFEAKTAGVLAWSLRFRSETGGFYFHKDFSDSDSLQYPGARKNAHPAEEPEIFKALASWAGKISGNGPKAEGPPVAPVLLPVVERGLSWQGSSGALHYRLEGWDGSQWNVVRDQVVDTGFVDGVLGREAALPLVTLADGESKQKFRVIAVNASGNSSASNEVTP